MISVWKINWHYKSELGYIIIIIIIIIFIMSELRYIIINIIIIIFIIYNIIITITIN